jgi:hypothetical protein
MTAWTIPPEYAGHLLGGEICHRQTREAIGLFPQRCRAGVVPAGLEHAGVAPWEVVLVGREHWTIAPSPRQSGGGT